MEEQRAWEKSRKRKRLRITACLLGFSLLVTSGPHILTAVFVRASEQEGPVYVSAFGALPEEVREQIVSIGTVESALQLPDSLEAVVPVEDSGLLPEEPVEGSEVLPEEGQPENPEGGETLPEESGEVEGNLSGEESGTEQGGSYEECGEENIPEESGEEEGSGETEEYGEAEESGEEEEEPEDSGEARADIGLRAETHTVLLAKYYGENELVIETLEPAAADGQETAPEGNAQDGATDAGSRTENITINGVTWQAVIIRIAALPDTEAYLAQEPEQEEACADWLLGLYDYAWEALDICEAYCALTEDQQARVPQEACAKLNAWVEIAKEAAQMGQVMTAEETDAAEIEDWNTIEVQRSNDRWMLVRAP